MSDMGEAADNKNTYSSRKAMQEYAQKILAQLPKVDRVHDLAQMNDAISGMLALLGECSGCQRVYLFDRKEEENPGASSFETYSAISEWCAPGVSSQKASYQSVRTENLHGWVCELKKGNVVTIRNIETIREAMPRMYAQMKRMEIHAEITVPIFRNLARESSAIQ